MSIATRIEAIEEHIGDIYDTLELGGADLTGVNKNLVNVKSQLKDRYLDFMNNGTWGIWNNCEKVTGEGTSLSLSPTIKAPMKNDLKGNTSQTGTPTPSSPIPVNVVSGDNEIVVCGKNLCNGVSQGLWINGSGTQYGKSTGDSGLYIKLDGISSYTVSTSISQTRYRIGLTNDDIPSLGDTFNSRSLSIGYIYDNTNNSNTINSVGYKYLIVNATDLTKIQIEKGNQATTYEPYQGNTYNIDLPEGMELCKIGNYQDYIYKEDNKWYLHKEIGKKVYNGTEDWSASGLSVTGYKGYYINDFTKILYANSTIITNHFKQRPYADWSALVQDDFVETSDNAIGFRIQESLASNLANWKTWLGNNNVICYYALTTSYRTNTEITYGPLIYQLEAWYQAKSKNGQTNISQINNDLPFIINSTMLKEV